MIDRNHKIAFFIDIDGTLIADSFKIPEKNIFAIEKARKDGHKVFINTGRSRGNIPPKLFEQAQFDGVLSGNGTVIEMGGDVIEKHFLEKRTMLDFARLCFECDNLWAVFEGFSRSYAIPGRNRGLSDIEIPVSSFDEFFTLAQADDFQVTAIGKNTNEKINEFIDKHFTYFEFKNYYDIAPAGCNKADTMLKAAEITGIPQSNCVAIGDSGNDYEMLKKAGTGVAVSNAQEKVLKCAEMITLSNAEGGVGEAILKIISER